MSLLKLPGALTTKTRKPRRIWMWLKIEQQGPRGYAGFGPCFHLPGFHFGTGFLSHSHILSLLSRVVTWWWVFKGSPDPKLHAPMYLWLEPSTEQKVLRMRRASASRLETSGRRASHSQAPLVPLPARKRANSKYWSGFVSIVRRQKLPKRLWYSSIKCPDSSSERFDSLQLLHASRLERKGLEIGLRQLSFARRERATLL